MSTELQTTQRTGGLTAWLRDDEVRGKFAAMLGNTIPVDQFTSHMLTAFQDPKVIQCSDKSKYKAIHECAVLSLLPTLGQVIMIPYGDELKAMPTWQGYKAVMERHPDVLEVIGTLVHVRDSFQYHNEELQHDFDPLDSGREFNSVDDLRGGYCTIFYTNGRRPKRHFTTAKQIGKAKKCAKTQNVWNKWYEQMAIKTLYRDCYARRAVPVDPLVGEKLHKMSEIDDAALGNDPNRVADDRPQARQLAKPLTTDDIMDAPKSEPQLQPPEPTTEPVSEPSVAEADAPSGMTPGDRYLAYVEEADHEERLDWLLDAVEKELSPHDLEAVKAAIGKKREWLGRGERSNGAKGGQD